MLRQADAGWTAVEAGAGVGVSAKAAWEIGKRYQEGGLAAAIYDAPRPGQKPLPDAEHGQRIIAMVCGPPPAGRARWSMRLAIPVVKITGPSTSPMAFPHGSDSVPSLMPRPAA